MPEAEIVIWGPPAPEMLSERLARYLSPPLTPLHLRELPTRISFRVCPEGDWEIGPARIHAAPVTHPGPTLGYRISKGATFSRLSQPSQCSWWAAHDGSSRSVFVQASDSPRCSCLGQRALA
jgi:hypothetical protein